MSTIYLWRSAGASAHSKLDISAIFVCVINNEAMSRPSYVLEDLQIPSLTLS
jgi:hypothetical protein